MNQQKDLFVIRLLSPIGVQGWNPFPIPPNGPSVFRTMEKLGGYFFISRFDDVAVVPVLQGSWFFNDVAD